ncbi:ribosomal 40S subunit protein S1B [Coelomomyces lativittatus]|nr:ribosomal 40S subunit protein S1B [Coelomomyces lativittatus]
MHMTSDKLRSLVKKRRSTIEAFTDVKTADGYLLRVFVIGFTKPHSDQIKKTCYAQTSQIRKLRKKMFEIVIREATTVDLKDLVKKFVAETIGRTIEKDSVTIFPLENVFVRKVKILKAPKFDLGRLLDLHGGAAASESQPASGTKIESKWVEPPVLDSV